jgi:hypothetical protein
MSKNEIDTYLLGTSFIKAKVSANLRRKNAPTSGEVSIFRTISSAVLNTEAARFNLPSLAYS